MTSNRGKASRPRGYAFIAAGLLVAGLCLGMTANATTITASVGGVPTGADHYENFDSLPLGNAGGTTASGITVSFTPAGNPANAQAVQGTTGQYAAPYLSGGNGTLFGDPTNGADTTTYLTAGSTGVNSDAAVTLQFTGPQRYFGLLWGSVDDYNTLTFYLGNALVTSFTGTDVGHAAGAGTCIGGNQQAQGTCYVNINLSTAFDRVVATSTQYAFEFDNVAFSANPVGVPEPGVAGMFLLGLLLVGSGYWYQKRRIA